MDSSDSMDDSFKSRVQRVFGSLSSSHSPWSLTDDEVQKREWRRDSGASRRDDDRTPCSSSFDGLFAKGRKNCMFNRRKLEDDLEDLDDADELLGGNSTRGDSDDRDEWEIRSSIGLDSTLDNEEEEDEYDKVAEGREDVGDRLYMRDVTDHGPFVNFHNVLPGSVHDAPRDPRANHFAASRRLKEDEAEAQKHGSIHHSEESMPSVVEPHVREFDDGDKLKPILKRKDEAATSNVQKRVRFGPGCKDDDKASDKPQYCLKDTLSKRAATSDDNSLLDRTTPGVPDYLLNPSKYTRYSLDSDSEFDDESNSQACLDFFKMVKMSKPEGSSYQSGDASSTLPKSVTFIPRKKESDARPMDDSSKVKQNQEDGSVKLSAQMGFPVGIAAGETQRIEVTSMEDDLETSSMDGAVFQKPCRHYRARSK